MPGVGLLGFAEHCEEDCEQTVTVLTRDVLKETWTKQ